MTMPSAKVIADSVSPDGHRLTTMEVVIHRFVLAEFNTHRMFSRNSASSRARPMTKTMQAVWSDCAYPVTWPAEKPGMQGGDSVVAPDLAKNEWYFAMQHAHTHVENLMALGVHKSVANRLIEPFMWHTVIVSATEWDGFWRQRCSPLAQPEMRVAAERMREAYNGSEPQELTYGQWHLPYVRESEYDQIEGNVGREQLFEAVKKISVARCARVSYLTHDGVHDFRADLELYDRLVTADPPHASPLEHVARPKNPTVHEAGTHTPGNFRGWIQLRHEVLGW